MACVEMQGEIRTRVAAFIPTIDFALVGANGSSDGFFSCVQIGPCGGGGDIAFAIETFAKLRVGAADVLVEGVAAALFVAREIVAIASVGASFGIAWLRVSGWCGCGCLTARSAIVRRSGLARDKRER